MRVAWLVVLLNVMWVASAWAFLTDTNVHTEPTPPPALATAGAIATDPIFGRTILRLTDTNDSAQNCSVTYSNKPMLNYNNTRIAALCTVGYNRFKVFDFDPDTMERTNGRIQSNPPAGFQEYGVQWSHTNASKFYGVGGKALYEVTIAPTGTTWTNTRIRDFAADFAGTGATQMSMSEDNDVFAFHFIGSSGYLVYKRSTNTILLNVNNEGSINEVEIDKSGRYLVALKDSGVVDVWDLQGTPIKTRITVENFNHRAMGNGFVAHRCTSQNLCKRNLATPNTVTIFLSTGWSYSNTQDHFSLTGNDAWFMSCRYTTNGEAVTKAYDSECLEVSTTGNRAVRRHVHHRSKILNNDYAASPKGSVSYDGRFIAFTSNWGNANGRRDVYIAKILPAPESGDTPPSAPVNFRIQ